MSVQLLLNRIRDRLSAPGWLIAVFVAVVYAGASVPDGGGFVAMLLSWLGLATLLLTMELPQDA